MQTSDLWHISIGCDSTGPITGIHKCDLSSASPSIHIDWRMMGLPSNVAVGISDVSKEGSAELAKSAGPRSLERELSEGVY